MDLDFDEDDHKDYDFRVSNKLDESESLKSETKEDYFDFYEYTMK